MDELTLRGAGAKRPGCGLSTGPGQAAFPGAVSDAAPRQTANHRARARSVAGNALPLVLQLPAPLPCNAAGSR